MKNRNRIMKMVFSALFLALAYVLPFLTGQIKEIGQMLCPMHLPVLLCGFICGWQWGACVGFIAPLFRSVTLGMPALFPSAFCMAFELAAYGIMAGLMYKCLPRKRILIYVSLIISMIVGRVVWTLVFMLVSGAGAGFISFYVLLGSQFRNALLGIIAQLVIIPPVVMLVENTSLMKGSR